MQSNNSFPLPTLNVRASIAFLATQRNQNKLKKKSDNDDDISEISFDSADNNNDDNDVMTNNDIDNNNNEYIKSSASVASSTSSKRSSIYKRVKKKNDTNIFSTNDNDDTKDSNDSIHVACYKGDIKRIKVYLQSNGHAINDPIKFMPYMLISEYEKVSSSVPIIITTITFIVIIIIIIIIKREIPDINPHQIFLCWLKTPSIVLLRKNCCS